MIEMKMDFLTLALAALVPLVVGGIWYSKMLFANAWLASTKMTEEEAKGANMAVLLIATYVISFMVSMILQMLVIHQSAVLSTVMNHQDDLKNGSSELQQWLVAFFGKYGTEFRTFKHGALHGFMTGLFMATPIITLHALYERKGFKYIAINGGYWIVSMAIMGGIICQFAKVY